MATDLALYSLTAFTCAAAAGGGRQNLIILINSLDQKIFAKFAVALGLALYTSLCIHVCSVGNCHRVGICVVLYFRIYKLPF